MINIRNERESDFKTVEEITRRAFYNLYSPGCAEHYLVHIMRGHEDFIPEPDFVAELDGRKYIYRDSPVMQLDEKAAQRFDDALPPMEKKELPGREEFYIISNSVLR